MDSARAQGESSTSTGPSFDRQDDQCAEDLRLFEWTQLACINFRHPLFRRMEMHGIEVARFAATRA